jgi:hypothetical protein
MGFTKSTISATQDSSLTRSCDSAWAINPAPRFHNAAYALSGASLYHGRACVKNCQSRFSRASSVASVRDRARASGQGPSTPQPSQVLFKYCYVLFRQTRKRPCQRPRPRPAPLRHPQPSTTSEPSPPQQSRPARFARYGGNNLPALGAGREPALVFDQDCAQVLCKFLSGFRSRF